MKRDDGQGRYYCLTGMVLMARATKEIEGVAFK
jgi:hypothetical protein